MSSAEVYGQRRVIQFAFFRVIILAAIYLPQSVDFLAGATDLPKDALTQLTQEHILTTKAFVDAQATMDWTATAAADRMAGQHLEMIADPLAKASVAKLPDLFR